MKKDNTNSTLSSTTRILVRSTAFIILFVSVLIILFVQDNNIIVLNSRTREISDLKKEIKAVNDTTQYYRRKLRELNTSREELERISREQYHMKRSSEDVYITDIE